MMLLIINRYLYKFFKKVYTKLLLLDCNYKRKKNNDNKKKIWTGIIGIEKETYLILEVITKRPPYSQLKTEAKKQKINK